MDSLDVIKQQINAGDRNGARLALRELLKIAPDDIDAWALLAILLSDPAEKAECYRQILRVNPGDRHAAVWLEALEPELQRSSPGTMPTEWQPAGEPIREPDPGAEEPFQRPQGVALPGIEDGTKRQTLDRDMDLDPSDDLARWPEAQPRPPGLLERIVGRRQRRQRDARGVVSLPGEGEDAIPPGSLNPADILRMAGGPLPPEERRKCPDCGAVVSRSDSRCPWCSASLPETGQG